MKDESSVVRDALQLWALKAGEHPDNGRDNP